MTAKLALGWGALSCVNAHGLIGLGGFLTFSSSDPLSYGGYTRSPDIRIMVANAITSFCGVGPKRVWACYGFSTEQLIPYLRSIGHTVTQAGVGGPSIIPSLVDYDCILVLGTTSLTGTLSEIYASLWAYASSGGAIISPGGHSYGVLSTNTGFSAPGPAYNPADWSCQPVGDDPIFANVGAIEITSATSVAAGIPVMGEALAYNVSNDAGTSPAPQIFVWRR
jgi:hypothetical protein